MKMKVWGQSPWENFHDHALLPMKNVLFAKKCLIMCSNYTTPLTPWNGSSLETFELQILVTDTVSVRCKKMNLS